MLTQFVETEKFSQEKLAMMVQTTTMDVLLDAKFQTLNGYVKGAIELQLLHAYQIVVMVSK